MSSIISYDGYILSGKNDREIIIGSDTYVIEKLKELFGNENDIAWYISPGTCGLAMVLHNLVPIIDVGTWLGPIKVSSSFQDILIILELLHDHANSLKVENKFYAQLDNAFYKNDTLNTVIAYLKLSIKSQ